MESNELKALVALTDESIDVECKSIFEWPQKVTSYLKAMAAFANHNGGYLVFGYEQKAKTWNDVSTDFDKIGIEEITDQVQKYFSPAMKFRILRLNIDGNEIRVFQVSKWDEYPSICKKDGDGILDGQIYYRYPGKSISIRHGELLSMINKFKKTDELSFNKLTRKNDIRPELNIQPQYAGGQHHIDLTVVAFKNDLIIHRINMTAPNNSNFLRPDLVGWKEIKVEVGRGMKWSIAPLTANPHHATIGFEVIFSDTDRLNFYRKKFTKSMDNSGLFGGEQEDYFPEK